MRVLSRTGAALAIASVIAALPLAAQRVTPNAYAITNARIVPVSAPAIERGTIVIRDGLIVAVGASVAVPADARVVDGNGLTIYPGFIDAYGTLGLRAATGGGSGFGGGGFGGGAAPARPAGAPNSSQPIGLQPEVRAVDQLVEITDFLCPACAAAHRTLDPLIDSLVDAGVLVHRVVEVPHQAGSLAVSVAAACAWTEGAETYWRYRSVLFEAQRSVASTYPVLPELVRLARYADADSSRLGRCLDERGEDFTARFAKGLQVVREVPVSYTPVFALNGRVFEWNTLARHVRGLRK